MGDWLARDFAIFCAPGQNWMLIVLTFSLVGTVLSLWLQR